MKARQILLPISTEEKIADNDSVRILDEIIDQINTPNSKFKYRKNHISDKTMLKIIIYGNMEQISTLRKLQMVAAG